MAIVLIKKYSDNISNIQDQPLVYVDSINSESYLAEMYNYTTKYIRESDESKNHLIVKRINHMAKDENDIYYNKKDGLWIVSDEKQCILTLYKKTTRKGYLYNSIYMDKIFTLSYKKCSKIVPQVFKKTSKHDNFKMELAEKVLSFKNRE